MTHPEQITTPHQSNIDDSPEPAEHLAPKERLQTPTLAFLLKMDISDILLRKMDGTRRFTIIQNQRGFTFDVSRYPAVIFKEFFRGTRFPTIEEVTEKLPVDEQENFFDYLQELNEVIVDHLRITLEPGIKTVNGKTSSFLIPKQVPSPTERPRLIPRNNQPQTTHEENGTNESNTTRIAERIKLADSIDPRHHQDDPRIPVRLIERLTPTEASALLQFSKTSEDNPMAIPQEGRFLMLVGQLNHEINTEGLKIEKTTNGGYYLVKIDELGI